MNQNILEIEVNYARALLEESLKLLEKLGSGESLESALCFCLYNGLERLLKIGIAMEEHQNGIVINLKKMGHNIVELYKKFIGDRKYAEISTTNSKIAKSNGLSSSVTEIYKNEFLLLKQIDEFADAKTGRYTNLDNLFNINATPYTYVLEFLEQISINSLLNLSIPFKEDSSYEDYMIDSNIFIPERIQAAKIALYNLLEPIYLKFLHINSKEHALFNFYYFMQEFKKKI